MGIGITIAILIAKSDVRFLRDSRYVTLFYVLSISLLVLVLIVGKTVKSAELV